MSIVFIISTALTAYLGSVVTGQGMGWYEIINLPSFTPPGRVIGLVWTLIFIMFAVSAIVWWRRVPKPLSKRSCRIVTVIFLNLFLNFLWSYLFFGRHLIGWAVIEMFILNVSIIVLIWQIWKRSQLSSVLLIPYFVWVSFATILAWRIWSLN